MEVIDLLLRAGGDPLLRSKEGDTPLELSKRGGCGDCYRALLKAQYREAPVIYAVRTGNLNELRALIDRKADVNLRDKSGLTALLYATALVGGSKLVNELLGGGADSSVHTPTGQTIGMDRIVGGLQFRLVGGGTTPLMLAAMNADSESISALVDSRADISAKNDKGETACQLLPAPLNQNDPVMELIENEARRRQGLPPKASAAPNSSSVAEAKKLLCK